MHTSPAINLNKTQEFYGKDHYIISTNIKLLRSSSKQLKRPFTQLLSVKGSSISRASSQYKCSNPFLHTYDKNSLLKLHARPHMASQHKINASGNKKRSDSAIWHSPPSKLILEKRGDSPVVYINSDASIEEMHTLLVCYFQKEKKIADKNQSGEVGLEQIDMG
jgi:hypothetical protein